MKKEYVLSMTIADITIIMHINHRIWILNSFKEFLGVTGSIFYNVNYNEVSELPKINGTLIYVHKEFDIYKDANNQYIWLFKDAVNNDKAYAITIMNYESKKIDVQYLEIYDAFFSETGNCFFHIGWENILLYENRFILHSSCINTVYGGILFVGPSGIGKSTQADMWCNYKNSKLINGDRIILVKKNGEWYGYGSPYAGSSKCYVNDYCKIKAVVVLDKADYCSIKKISSIDAFSKIYSQITVNSWNECAVSQACDLVAEFVKDLPIYLLACTPDETAVKLLSEKLMEGEKEWS